MGSESSSSTSSATYSDSYNKLVTPTVSGDRSFALGLVDSSLNSAEVNMLENVGNTYTSTTSNSSLGASSPVSSEGSGSSGSSGSVNWKNILPWILGFIALFVIYLLFRKGGQ